MDFLAQYGDEEEEEQIISAPSVSVETAPTVDTTGLTLYEDEGKQLVVPTSATVSYFDSKTKQVFYNPKYDELYAPVAGPENPYTIDGVAAGLKNHKQGMVEDAHMSAYIFDEQYNTFDRYGYATDPSGTKLVGDMSKMRELDGASVYDRSKRAAAGGGTGALGDLAQYDEDEDEEAAAGGAGPSGGQGEAEAGEPEEEEEEDEVFGKASLNPASDAYLLSNKRSPWAGKVEVKPVGPEGLSEEQKEYVEYMKKRRAEKRGQHYAAPGEEEDKGDHSFFHGKSETNYAGESWINPPKDRKKENEHTYIPKKWIHTWSGHTKGVSAIRFFPKHGHLLLSASMDCKIKIWDVHNSGKCMRTYLGHTKAMRDICFSNDGRRFVSSSWDKNVKLWDTETGQCITTLSTGKTPLCVKLHPDDDKQNICLAGCSDKKIVSWDMNTGDKTQEYDEHLAGVNTITFCDENRRFITSSDDKSIRVWEFGIPVQIKYIADPAMHSMPSIQMHPNGNWFVAQSLDNTIVTYSTRERFRVNRKKVFSGHQNAGYACQVNMSPDGRFVLSGDASGKLWFWDWKTHKVFRSFKAHDQVTIGCEWHPLEQSKVATCSWDGTIKYWD